MRLLTIIYLTEKKLVQRRWKKSEITILTIAYTHCYTKTHLLTNYTVNDKAAVLKQLYSIFFCTTNTSDVCFHYPHPPLVPFATLALIRFTDIFHIFCYN